MTNGCGRIYGESLFAAPATQEYHRKRLEDGKKTIERLDLKPFPKFEISSGDTVPSGFLAMRP